MANATGQTDDGARSDEQHPFATFLLRATGLTSGFCIATALGFGLPTYGQAVVGGVLSAVLITLLFDD